MRCLVLALLLAAAPALAHEPPTSADCQAPERPPKSDVERWNAFVSAVDVFRACIDAYADVHYDAADSHRQAAEAAVTRWNAFVHAELNVPEDFPLQPQDGG